MVTDLICTSSWLLRLDANGQQYKSRTGASACWLSAFGGYRGSKGQGEGRGQACQTKLHGTLWDLGQSKPSSGRGQPGLTSAEARFSRGPGPCASERPNTPGRGSLVGQDERPRL